MQNLLGVIFIVLFMSGCKKSEIDMPKKSTFPISVWEISYKENRSFIVGSVGHEEREGLQIRHQLDSIYDLCDNIYYTDIKHVLNSSSIDSSRNPYFLSYDNVLSPEACKRLEDNLDSLPSPLPFLAKGKDLLVVLELIDILTWAGGNKIESRFKYKGKEDGKSVNLLDNRDEYYADLSGLSNVDDILFYSIETLPQKYKYRNEIWNAWKNGSIDILDSILNPPIKPYIETYEKFLQKRIMRYRDSTIAMLKSNETAFVILDVKYLGGENGLLNSLRKKRYKIKQVEITPPTRRHQYLLERYIVPYEQVKLFPDAED